MGLELERVTGNEQGVKSQGMDLGDLSSKMEKSDVFRAGFSPVDNGQAKK